VTAGQRRYAEMIAMRLAVEILAGQSRSQPAGDSTLRAAVHLGATATNDRLVALGSLVALLALQPGPRYRPTATVTRALHSQALAARP
jgi:hypothetical protein